jgi:hypothetical protein
MFFFTVADPKGALTKRTHRKAAEIAKPFNCFEEVLNKLIPFMVRQAHHERNQTLAVRPELVEGLVQRFLD